MQTHAVHLNGWDGLMSCPRIRQCLSDAQGRVRAAAAQTLSGLARKNEPR